MREVYLKIENIKCSGCIDTITKKLSNQIGLSEIRGDVNSKTVKFTLTDEGRFSEILKLLNDLGFPPDRQD